MKWIYFGEISVSLMRSREIKHINQKWMLAPARGIRARFVKPQKWTGFLPPSVLVTIIGYHSYHQCVINTLMQVPRGARRLQGWAKPLLSKESSFLFLRGRIRHPPSQSKYSIRFHLLFIQFQNCLLKPVRLVPCRCRKVLPAPLYSQWRPFGLATPRFWLRIEDGAGKCYRRRIFGRSDLLQRPSSVPNLCFSWIPHPGHPLGVECFVASQGKVFNLDLQKCLWSKRFHRSLCSSTFQIATNAKGRGVLRLLLLQQQIKMLCVPALCLQIFIVAYPSMACHPLICLILEVVFLIVTTNRSVSTLSVAMGRYIQYWVYVFLQFSALHNE